MRIARDMEHPREHALGELDVAVDAIVAGISVSCSQALAQAQLLVGSGYSTALHRW